MTITAIPASGMNARMIGRPCSQFPTMTTWKPTKAAASQIIICMALRYCRRLLSSVMSTRWL